MKNVVDLFIAKDRTSLFWFTMACASILLSSVYVSKIIADVNTKPVYVIMDRNGTYYYAPSIEIKQATPLHEAQTRLAMETIYTREPRALKFKTRLPMLFAGGAVTSVTAEFDRESAKFIEEARSQTVEVQSIEIGEPVPGTAVVTRAKGILTQTRTFGGKTETTRFSVSAGFGWGINMGMGTDNSNPPTICIAARLSPPTKLEEEP